MKNGKVTHVRTINGQRTRTMNPSYYPASITEMLMDKRLQILLLGTRISLFKYQYISCYTLYILSILLYISILLSIFFSPTLTIFSIILR